jgi:hypothetical protein
VETQKRRYPGYDQRDPASVSFAILALNTLPNLLHSQLLTLVAWPYGFRELDRLDRTQQLQQQ